MLIILKNQINNQLSIVILKKNFAYYKMFFFSSQIYLKGLFYITQILILPALLLKWNKMCYIKVFLIKIFSSRWVSSFSQSSKIHFLNDDQEWTEKNVLVFLFGVIINKLFCVTANIQLPKFRIPEEVKLS